jgi:hypothetical protein
MTRKRIFFIYAPSYDEKIGGSIVLHKLCDLINRGGDRAYLYPIGSGLKIGDLVFDPLSFVLQLFHKITTRIKFKTLSKYITPVALIFKNRNAIVIYPEIVSGNPLGAKNVVRWLLHKPGFHSGLVDFNPSDLIFYFQEVFNDPYLNCNIGGKLQVMDIRTDIYTRTNFGARSGSCYLLRKGKKREILHDLNCSIMIDNLSHEEVAKLFNQSEYFISYDSYTLYSQYAALCGCISIVIPELGVNKEAWQPVDELRYGVSYGFDEIELARETQGKAKDYLTGLEKEFTQSVREFVCICTQYFNAPNKSTENR